MTDVVSGADRPTGPTGPAVQTPERSRPAQPGTGQAIGQGGRVARGGRGDQSAGAATGVAMAGAVVTTVANFGLAYLVARAGAVFAGLFFAATALVTIVGNSTGLGTMTGLVYFMPVARGLVPPGSSGPTVAQARAASPNPRGLLRVALGPVVVAGLAGGLALALGAGFLARATAADQAADMTLMLRVLAPAVPAWALTMSLLGATRGLGSMTPTVAVTQVGRPLAQLVGVGLVVLAIDDPAPWAAALAWGAPVVVGAIAAAVAVHRLGGFAGRGPSVVSGREFWHYTRPRSLSTTLQIALERLDVVLVSTLAGPGPAGVYGTLTRYITAGNFLVFSIGQACAPGLRRTMGGDDRPAARHLLQQTTGWMVLVAWPYLLLVAVKPDTLIGVLNASFVGQGAALAVLALFMLASSAAGPADLALLMVGRSRAALGAVALALAIDLGLAWLLVPRIGLVGAALAWGLAVVAQNGLATWLVHRSGRVVAFGRPALVAATGSVLAVGPVGLLTPDSFVGLVITAVVAGTLYVLWCLRFHRSLGLPSPTRLRHLRRA